MNTSKHVLIIEDTPLQRAIIENITRELGYTPISAGSFTDHIRESLAMPSITFVLLDIVLLDDLGNSIGDGLQICQEIKHIRPELPVIMISAEADAEARQFAELQGADGYIVKPFKVEELERLLQDF